MKDLKLKDIIHKLIMDGNIKTIDICHNDSGKPNSIKFTPVDFPEDIYLPKEIEIDSSNTEDVAILRVYMGKPNMEEDYSGVFEEFNNNISKYIDNRTKELEKACLSIMKIALERNVECYLEYGVVGLTDKPLTDEKRAFYIEVIKKYDLENKK